MKEEVKKSEFYHFGILPQVCIHSIVEDEYSAMYIPQDKCDCGCNEWIDSTMFLAKISGIPCLEKEVHRCKDCNKVRIATHKGIIEERE